MSNSWDKYTPTVFVIEAYSTNITGVLNSDIYKDLFALGYALIAKAANTSIYKIKN